MIGSSHRVLKKWLRLLRATRQWELLEPMAWKSPESHGAGSVPSTVVSGRDICRRMFLEGLYVFGTSTSVLYRSELVRGGIPFITRQIFTPTEKPVLYS